MKSRATSTGGRLGTNSLDHLHFKYTFKYAVEFSDYELTDRFVPSYLTLRLPLRIQPTDQARPRPRSRLTAYAGGHVFKPRPQLRLPHPSIKLPQWRSCQQSSPCWRPRFADRRRNNSDLHRTLSGRQFRPRPRQRRGERAHTSARASIRVCCSNAFACRRPSKSRPAFRLYECYSLVCMD